MNVIKNKIRSQAGASITFALLLFLVCAVISSVVIVAASTAGGSMSTVREMDQRYYAATSAADVLRGIFDGQSVMVSYTKANNAVASTSTTETGLLADASKALVAGTQISTPLPPIARKVDNIQYTCTISASLSNDGMLAFDIAVSGGQTNNGTYTLRVTFSSNIMEVDASAGSEAENAVINGKAKVSWKMNSVKKVRG